MYLGIDIGTSAVKAAVVDDTGSVVDQASAALEVSRPQPLWSEQNPADWWSAANNAVSGLKLPVRKAVRAIGLTGQMHGATLLDKQQRALRPAILWNDGRSAAECAELEAAVPDMTKITGNRAMPGFTAPKLLWVRRHEPKIFAETAMVLLPKDYVRLRMTGQTSSDMSDSAGTLWLDVAQRRWSSAMLAGTGLDESHMPTLSEGNEITGELRAEIAEAWGMSRVPVAAGGGDNAAGAIGVGVVRPGDAFLSLGTSGVLFLANDGYRPNPAGGVHTFCHAVPKHWHQMSVILSAASCVDWAARLCGLGTASALFAAAEAAQQAERCGNFPALFVRRAHAAQRSQRARRAVWPDAGDIRRAHRAGGARRRRVRLSRRHGCAARQRRQNRRDLGDRRRRPFAILGQNFELGIAPAVGLPRQRRGGARLWRRAARAHGQRESQHRGCLHAAADFACG